MEYKSGQIGRVIAARLFEGENVYECIEKIAKDENIKSAAVFLTGGFRKASVVVGPKQERPKLEGDFREFIGPGEVLGVGTIYCDGDEPKMHLHGAMGKADGVLVGCPRGGAKCFLILEVTIIEMVGVGGKRKLDEETGVKLLRFE